MQILVEISRINEAGTLYLVLPHSLPFTNAIGFSRRLALGRPAIATQRIPSQPKATLSPLLLCLDSPSPCLRPSPFPFHGKKTGPLVRILRRKCLPTCRTESWARVVRRPHIAHSLLPASSDHQSQLTVDSTVLAMSVRLLGNWICPELTISRATPPPTDLSAWCGTRRSSHGSCCRGTLWPTLTGRFLVTPCATQSRCPEIDRALPPNPPLLVPRD